MLSKEKIKVGMKVQVTNDDGTFEGIVKHWHLFTDDLTIEPGYNVNTKKIVAHSINFYKDPSLKIVALDDELNSTISEIDKSSSFSQSNSSIDRINANNRGNHSRLNTSNRLNKSVEKNTNKSTSQDTKLGPYLLISDSHSIITVLNFIISAKVKSVGLQFFGNLTRDGYISLICLDVSHDYVYLLDFNNVKEENNEVEVMDLLKVILSDSSIVKIMYNCAFASDILYHQHNIDLRNIFDLEVAFAYVNSLNNFTVNSTCIETLIRENLPKIEEIKEIHEKIDWNKRPISSNTKQFALIQTSYMIDLYKIYYEKIFEKFSQGCDLYVNILRECENEAKLNHFYENKQLLLKELQPLFGYKKETERKSKVTQMNLFSKDFKKGDSGIYKTSTDNDESDVSINSSFKNDEIKKQNGSGEAAIHKMFDRSSMLSGYNFRPAGSEYSKSLYINKSHKSNNTTH